MIDFIIDFLLLLLALAARDGLRQGRRLVSLFLEGFELFAELVCVDGRGLCLGGLLLVEV